MIYINEINRFWRLATPHALSSNAKILYLYLLHESNAVGLRPFFRLSVSSIRSGSGLSEKQYSAAKRRLVEAGFLSICTEGNGHIAEIHLPLMGTSAGYPTGGPNGQPVGGANGWIEKNHPSYIYRKEESRESATKSYDPDAFFAASVARGERGVAKEEKSKTKTV